MLRHAGDGVPAAQAAELASAARFKISANPQPTARCGQAEADRAKMLGALERFDETTTEQVLDKLLATRGVMTIIQDIVLPLLRELGERWAGAHVSVAQEHFISAFIHGRLLGLARGWDRGLGQRGAVGARAERAEQARPEVPVALAGAG
jgi:MerR family transcriptional regulator, light-induced transcriptional regulator